MYITCIICTLCVSETRLLQSRARTGDSGPSVHSQNNNVALDPAFLQAALSFLWYLNFLFNKGQSWFGITSRGGSDCIKIGFFYGGIEPKPLSIIGYYQMLLVNIPYYRNGPLKSAIPTKMINVLKSNSYWRQVILNDGRLDLEVI